MRSRVVLAFNEMCLRERRAGRPAATQWRFACSNQVARRRALRARWAGAWRSSKPHASAPPYQQVPAVGRAGGRPERERESGERKRNGRKSAQVGPRGVRSSRPAGTGARCLERIIKPQIWSARAACVRHFAARLRQQKRGSRRCEARMMVRPAGGVLAACELSHKAARLAWPDRPIEPLRALVTQHFQPGRPTLLITARFTGPSSSRHTAGRPAGLFVCSIKATRRNRRKLAQFLCPRRRRSWAMNLGQSSGRTALARAKELHDSHRPGPVRVPRAQIGIRTRSLAENNCPLPAGQRAPFRAQ